ncbi:hypothetical protein KHQ81_00970 [Mycoplasmatota bacterium]|nr:hypothetical protein KHQ81_00970 [Mycoplasmatota bacterium]
MIDYSSGQVIIFILFPILMYLFIKLTLYFKKNQFKALFWFLIWFMSIINIIFILIMIHEIILY